MIPFTLDDKKIMSLSSSVKRPLGSIHTKQKHELKPKKSKNN